MTFDKTKAMRNAEKYLSQGKIRAAIGEYEQVVKHDARDFGTINMLGDLYAKSSESKSAIRCYTAVADHYGKQGFAQKAIAVYNKISKIEPHSIETSIKLAELYKLKGSLNEARAHYTRLADHFKKQGQVIEALAMWKEIALLDPTDTKVYLSLADSYRAEGQADDARDAYIEGGTRFANAGSHEEAVAAFLKALELKNDDAKVLAAFVKSKFALGAAREAADRIETTLAEFPHSRELRFLLIDCLIEANDISEAEKAVIKLVEIEPANYPKLLELAHLYLAADDMDSATRILSMSSEHMLVGGQADDFHVLVSQILAKDPDQLDALRLLARYCSWQRDEDALCDSLIKLAQVAKVAESVDDERFALLQLTMIIPHEVAYTDRLREINDLHGFEQSGTEESLFDKRFVQNRAGAIDLSANAEVGVASVHEMTSEFAFSSVSGASEPFNGFAFTGAVTEVNPLREPNGNGKVTSATVSDDQRLRKELDSIRFYIDNGYVDLAAKAVVDLRGEFGEHPDISALDAELKTIESFAAEETSVTANDVHVIDPSAPAKAFDLGDLRSELGLEEAGKEEGVDYETHFSTAVAYQEMGLSENAIKEFQEAISLVKPNDGTRRFFSCANLLGHCFMEQGMPNLALTWFLRTLETSNLTDEEKQGLWYELAGAYEAEGDVDNAGRYFEQVYAENANFRDVSERVKSLAVNH